MPTRGATLRCAACNQKLCACERSAIPFIKEPSLAGHSEHYPKITGLDSHHSQPDSHVIVGTDGCDVWSVTGPHPGGQRNILEGHSAGVFMVAAHPEDPDKFVSADEQGHVMRFDAGMRAMECRTLLDFKCYSIAISSVKACSTADEMRCACNIVVLPVQPGAGSTYRERLCHRRQV
jgi:hypothetical protein